MVPDDAAGMRSGAALARAPSSTSVMRCEVSTLPAAIAAGGSALTTVPSGAITRIGRNSPAVDGTSSASRQRNTYIVADTAIAIIRINRSVLPAGPSR